MKIGVEISPRRIYLITSIISFVVLLMVFEMFAQGTLTNNSFYSPILNEQRDLQVYLPEGYNPQDSIIYPVIYLLHGITLNHTSYPFVKGILDNLIGDSTISTTIVVKPDGSCLPWVNSFYTNSIVNGNFEDYIVYDVIEFIDTTYKTLLSRDKRTIMGHSTGGYGAMKLALKHPDIYGGVASHSGHLDFNRWHVWIPTILAENGGVAPYSYNPGNGFRTEVFFTMASAFSPNLNNPPYFVDFPLDSMGNLIDSTFNKWLLHGCVHLAHNIVHGPNLYIYFDCGRVDEHSFRSFNTAFADSLDSLGISYIYEDYFGGHTSHIQQRFEIAFCFLDSLMNKITNIDVNYDLPIETPCLTQNYPNPFNPSTTIEFDLPRTSKVSVKIYNIIGEEVATLLSASLLSGSHSVDWDASNLASGVYLYRLQAGDYVETRKMMLMK